jgi:hypothetical protein
LHFSEKEAEKLVARIDDDGSLDISFEEWRDYLMFHPRLDPDLRMLVPGSGSGVRDGKKSGSEIWDSGQTSRIIFSRAY